MASHIPARVKWAVDVLRPEPSDRILEIGWGRGVAVELLCARLRFGVVVALDRSSTATSAAEAWNRAHVRAGRARFLNVALAEAVLEERFDRIFAINVNVFWLKPERELTVIRGALAPGGRLHLFYEPPSRARCANAEVECRRHLEANGFVVDEVLWTDLRPHVGLCLVASPVAGAPGRSADAAARPLAAG